MSATRLRAPVARRWLAGVVALLAWGSVYAGTARAEASCPNAGMRVGFSATLPDCRAYERVSGPGVEPYFVTEGSNGNVAPASKVIGESFAADAAVSGDRFGFLSIFTPPPGSPSDGPYFLATRGTSGWTTENVIPQQSPNNSGRTCFNAFIPKYSPDLSTAVFADGWGQEGHPFESLENNCGTDEPVLVPGEPEGFQNLFVRDTATATYRLVNQTPNGVTPDHAFYQAASEDISHVVFDERAALTPEAPPGDDLYEWAGAPGAAGTVRLVTWLPEGTPVQGTLAHADEPELLHSKGTGTEQITNAVSADGSRIYFVTGGNLYERVNADRPQSAIQSGACKEAAMACTYQVDAVQGGSSGGEGEFSWASTDGTRVFFTDTNELVPGASAAPGEPDLYEYDLTKAPGSRLQDLTKLSGGKHADVLDVVGMNETGEAASYVYFVADGVLSSATNSHGDSATLGQPNLYMRHAGTTTFIATLDPSGDVSDWEQHSLTTRVSRGGEFIAFNSIRSLTGFDNTDVSTGEPDQEIYLYDASHEALSCASCNPSGARPTAPTRIYRPLRLELFYRTPGSFQHFVSDDGRVFFSTQDELLPADTNGLSNVYEYHEGSLALISSGALNAPSYFYQATPSGQDVFFFTSAKLLPSATDGGIHVYDARVGGGFKEAPISEACKEFCRGPSSSAPPPLVPGSATFPPLAPPGKSSQATHGKIVKLKLSRHQASVSVTLTVSGPGRIGASGNGLRAARKSAARAGTYALTLRLSAATQRKLKRKGQLHLRIAVTFTPNGAGLERDHATTTLRGR